jgi:hypothetical protein
MPEMQLLQLAVEPSRLSWSHNNSVLQVHYAKPPALLAEVGGAELSLMIEKLTNPAVLGAEKHA